MLSQSKTPDEIESMRRGGSILAKGLSVMKQAAKPGVSTKYLSDLAQALIDEEGAEAAFLGYPGTGGAPAYPEAACISVNDAVVHGIPTKNQTLKSGDIVSLDLGVKYQDMIVDGAITIVIGDPSHEHQKLLDVTRKSLFAGLKQVKAGCKTGDIGQAIQEVLEAHHYGIVRDLVGHGVGYSIHEDPNIPNYGRKGTGSVLEEGMTVAIEPMATLGSHEIYIDSDGWTVRTRDQSKAAHFEHTVLVTAKGCEILTVDD